MEKEALIELLERHGIKSTPNRILVASTLEEASRPLSMTEIEETIGTIDKSSVFRTLSLFRESHLVHAFEDGSDVVRYELCMSESNEDDDTHVHFYCEACQKTFCLYDIPVPKVRIPDGYKAETANYIIRGFCPVCAKKMSR